jgi:uncharacterized membrane protein
VQHVDIAALQKAAELHCTEVIVNALPGAFADPSRPVALLAGNAPAEMQDLAAKAFTVGTERTYDQDPRFGFCVLAEIGSRALSPAVNDPGTAIDVIGRASRLLFQWGKLQKTEERTQAEYGRVWVPAITVHDLFDDFFVPIARDGARIVEVQLRLQKAFRAAVASNRVVFGEAANRHSINALKQAEANLTMEEERDAVRALAASVMAESPNEGNRRSLYEPPFPLKGNCLPAARERFIR